MTRPSHHSAYGPPGVVERTTSVARGLMAFGLGVPFGVVFGVSETLATDTGRSLDDWYLLAAGGLSMGVLLALVLARAAANLGAAVGSTIARCALVAAGAWVVLFNVGDTAAVAVLVVIGLAGSVPAALLMGIDALAHRPSARPIAAVGAPAASMSAGVCVGAFVMFLDPTLLWSDVAAVGGVVAAVGAWRRLGYPDRIRGASTRQDVPAADRTPAGVRILLAGALGVAGAGVVRIAPFLFDQWEAGVRYHLLALAAAGATGTAVLAGVQWLPARWQRNAPTEVDDAARLTALVAGLVLLVAISETLPGVVAGAGLAAGLALGGVVLLCAVGARGERNPATSIGAIGVVGAGAWVATWGTWHWWSDPVGSPRVALALSAVPALVAGAVVMARPLRDGAAVVVDDTALPNDTALPVAASPTPAVDPTGEQRTEPPALLDVAGVEFSYGTVQVLFGVDLQVRAGEVVALLGTNGAGKTTLLRTITGLATPSSGTIRMAGTDLAQYSASERVVLGINQIAAGAAVAPDLTVAENLDMFGHSLGAAAARSGRDRALEVFPKLGQRLGQRASSLSGGERQMLSLSKSLVLHPTLLIVDELTLGLAPVAVGALVPVIRRLHEEGSAVLLVEQSVHLALDVADRAYCIEKGRIVFKSDADALRADSGLLEAVYLEGIAAALEHRSGVAGGGAR